MAEPNDPSERQVELQKESLDLKNKEIEATAQVTEQLKKEKEALDGVDDAYTFGIGSLGNLNKLLKDHSITLDNITDKLTKNATMFGVLTTATIGATEAFRGMTNLDPGSLITFSDQAKTLFDVIRAGPGTSAASQAAYDAATAGIKGMMQVAGVGGKELDNIMSATGNNLVKFAQQALKSSDNILFLQNAMMQTATSGGSMQDFLKETGDDFARLNEVSKKYGDILSAAGATTGLSSTEAGKKEVESYADALAKLPQGYKGLADSIQIGTTKVNVLTAALQYAKGSGRDEASILNDMALSTNQYGLATNQALEYSSRMSQVSETLHARLEDVREAVNSSVSAFKGWVFGGADAESMTMGLSDAIGSYAKQLAEIGVPMQTAIKYGQQYTDSFANMSIAQRAFTSQMSGGPGGLMGAFQQEALLKQKGGLEKMMENARNTLTKMFGPIQSHQAAETNQGAANMYAKQLMILQSGIGGIKAKSQEEAEAMLESMRPGAERKAVATTPGRTLAQNMEAGKALEQMTMTKVGQVNIQTAMVRFEAGVAMNNALEDAMSTNSGRKGGSDGQGVGVNQTGRAELRDFMDKFQRSDNNMNPADLVKNTLSSMSHPIADAQNVAHALAQQMGSGNQEKVQDTTASVNAEFAKKRAMLGLGQAVMPEESTAGAQVGHVIAKGTQEEHTAGGQVGHAIPKTAGLPTEDVRKLGDLSGVIHKGSPIPVSLAPGNAITVNFVGICPHCKNPVQESAHAMVTAPGSNSQGR
jgi:hypothetical protein